MDRPKLDWTRCLRMMLFNKRHCWNLTNSPGSSTLRQLSHRQWKRAEMRGDNLRKSEWGLCPKKSLQIIVLRKSSHMTLKKHRLSMDCLKGVKTRLNLKQAASLLNLLHWSNLSLILTDQVCNKARRGATFLLRYQALSLWLWLWRVKLSY